MFIESYPAAGQQHSENLPRCSPVFRPRGFPPDLDFVFLRPVISLNQAITEKLRRSLVSFVRFLIQVKWSVARKPDPRKAVAVLTPGNTDGTLRPPAPSRAGAEGRPGRGRV